MPTVNDLTEILAGDITDDDFIIIYDRSAPASARTKKVRKDAFIAQIASATIAALTGTVTSLEFAAGATISDAQTADIDFTPGDITAGSTEDETGAMAGIATTDLLVLAFTEALPNGLMAQWWISAADTITVRFSNTTSGTISSATYTARVLALTLS